ncbi:MAG TPA: hypothetical protein DD648_08745, partial [Candidatus Omnitrophica bacterium]|nr:hypothetical protein [Candidatus Omnitrophota bacterium]
MAQKDKSADGTGGDAVKEEGLETEAQTAKENPTKESELEARKEEAALLAKAILDKLEKEGGKDAVFKFLMKVIPGAVVGILKPAVASQVEEGAKEAGTGETEVDYFAERKVEESGWILRRLSLSDSQEYERLLIRDAPNAEMILEETFLEEGPQRPEDLEQLKEDISTLSATGESTDLLDRVFAKTEGGLQDDYLFFHVSREAAKGYPGADEETKQYNNTLFKNKIAGEMLSDTANLPVLIEQAFSEEEKEKTLNFLKASYVSYETHQAEEKFLQEGGQNGLFAATPLKEGSLGREGAPPEKVVVPIKDELLGKTGDVFVYKMISDENGGIAYRRSRYNKEGELVSSPEEDKNVVFIEGEWENDTIVSILKNHGASPRNPKILIVSGEAEDPTNPESSREKGFDGWTKLGWLNILEEQDPTEVQKLTVSVPGSMSTEKAERVYAHEKAHTDTSSEYMLDIWPEGYSRVTNYAFKSKYEDIAETVETIILDPEKFAGLISGDGNYSIQFKEKLELVHQYGLISDAQYEEVAQYVEDQALSKLGLAGIDVQTVVASGQLAITGAGAGESQGTGLIGALSNVNLPPAGIAGVNSSLVNGAVVP